MTIPLIELKHVKKTFGSNQVLADVNLTIPAGKITTIIGKSGMGKSVLLKHIIGLLSPDEGSILYQGHPLSGMKRAEKKSLKMKFSYMFQGTALFDSMTVFENIALPLKERRLFSKTTITKKVREKLSQLDLNGVNNRYPAQISGGMKKRVALARALVTDPKIVLFDEPTTGLDPIRKNAAHSMILDYQKRFGFTGIVVSHEIPDIFFISDHMAMLDEGRIIFQGNSEEIQQSTNPIVQQFIHGLESRQDDLTGLLPHRQGVEKFKREMVRLQRHQIDFALVLITMCNIEAIDEMVGHVASQRILKGLANHVQDCIGITDSCSRLGLNRIMVLLSSSDIVRARTFCSELARELKNDQAIQLSSDPQKSITINAGFAQAKVNSTLEQLVSDAASAESLFYEFRVY
jgi:phospholipid/cholesterol/gamma-HCH transport system ATP-binding protein